MKYITREKNEKLQLTSWIEFELKVEENMKNYTEADIELLRKKRFQEFIEWLGKFRELSDKEEVDCEISFNEGIEQRESLLRKYLPEYIRKDVNNLRILASSTVDENLKDKLIQWKDEIMQDWEEGFKDYREYYENIKEKLPESVKKFNERNMHDEKISSASRIGEDKFVIKYKDEIWGQVFINFEGVKSLQISGDIIGDYWLYDEIFLSDTANFEYHVLLSKSEFKIEANEVYRQIVEKDYVSRIVEEKKESDEVFDSLLEILRHKGNYVERSHMKKQDLEMEPINNFICALKMDLKHPFMEDTYKGFEQYFKIVSQEATCVLQILKKINYMEMYNLLSEAIDIHNNDDSKKEKAEKFSLLDKRYSDVHIKKMYELFNDYYING